MDLTHFNALLPVIFGKRVTLISCVLFYNLLRLISSTIISGGITSHVSLARSLNSFVLPVHEVDVSLAPLLGRQCALLEKIPADYRLSFSRFNLQNKFENLAFYLQRRLFLYLPPEVRLAETQFRSRWLVEALTGCQDQIYLRNYS